MPPGIGVPPLPPLLWAIKNGKYAHALLLVNAGVNIDVLVDSYHEDGLLDNMKKGSKYIMQVGTHKAGCRSTHACTIYAAHACRHEP